MSSEKKGWLTTVTKLFSSGEQSNDRVKEPSNLSRQISPGSSNRPGSSRKPVPVNGSPLSSTTESGLHSSRNLRYLSPSVLERSVSKPGVSRPLPAEDIFGESSTTSRKRSFAHDQRPASVMDVYLNRDNPKRSRREQFANSMLVEETPRMYSDRLNSTWVGRSMGDTSSCVEFCHSPSSSNRSLIGRIGSTRSNSSTLSSKTKAILSHLERINTPAREARKLPVMRGSTVPSERWAPMHSCAPPLVKSSATVPSRIQLLSSSMAAQRKPYWRDITRRPLEREAASKEGQDKSSSSSVHPLFDLEKNGCHASSSCSKSLPKSGGDAPVNVSKPHVPSVKGSDGKSISSNVFNAAQLIDDGISEDKTANDLPLFAPPIKAAPAAGFLDDMVFCFDAPVERLPGQNVVEQTVAECDRSGSEGSESSGDDSDNEQSSSTSDAEEANEVDKEPKSSRPPTAADSETSGVNSSNATPASSKDVSPQTKEASWSCPDCFITNKNVSICAACGHNKDAATTASKTLISNISTFGKPATGGFQFGFGAQGVKDSKAPTSTVPASPKESVCGSSGSALSKPLAPSELSDHKQDSSKPPSANDASTVATAHKTSDPDKRVAWECPDCMVQNKESDDKCVCCGHVMYKSDGDSAKANASVFGDRAFKAAPLPSAAVSFGFGASNNATGSSGGIKFGFGTNGEKQAVAQQEPATITNISKADALPTATVTVISSAPPKEVPITKTSSTPTLENSTAKDDQTKPQLPTFSLGAGAAIFGAGAKPPLFGSSSSSMFNTSHSTGSLLTTSSSTTPAPVTIAINESHAASTAAPAPFATGAPSSGTKPFGLFDNKKVESSTKPPLFGSGLTFGNGPSTSEQVSSSTGNVVAGSNTETASNSLIGSSTGSSLFGSSAATKPMFSTFGNSADSKTFMGPSNSSAESFKPSPFGGAQSVSGDAQKPPLFGASATNPVNKPLFGANAATTAPTANGGLTFNFGSSNSNTFGTFNAANSSAPSLPSTSSTPSLFGSASSTADTSKPFQFGATIPAPTFQFGQSTALSGPTPFQFGSSQTTAPAAPTFQLPGITAPAAPSSNFSFTSSGARKLVAARRRLPQRK